MPLASTRRTGLVDQVIAQLRAQVDSGEWAVGDRIPTESELADQLEVGRNTVREAVRALAHAGLLEIRQGAGTFVRASSELGGALRRRVERSRLRESLEVRRALELESARLAADRRTEADLADMDHAIQLAEHALAEGDMAAFVEADVGLHHKIVQASHNSLLIELYGDIAQAVHETVAQAAQEHSTEHPVADHRNLVEAIRASDVTAATRETACYIDEGLTTMG